MAGRFNRLEGAKNCPTKQNINLSWRMIKKQFIELNWIEYICWCTGAGTTSVNDSIENYCSDHLNTFISLWVAFEMLKPEQALPVGWVVRARSGIHERRNILIRNIMFFCERMNETGESIDFQRMMIFYLCSIRMAGNRRYCAEAIESLVVHSISL